MNQDVLTQQILHYYPNFSPDALAEGLSFFQLKTFKSGQLILKEGSACSQLFFAHSSIVRCFYYDRNGERTAWMEPEKMFVTDFESFIKGTPSKYYLQFYQDTEVWVIARKNLLYLYEHYKDWAGWGIKLMEDYHVRILDLFTIMFRNNASENYQFIEDYFADFLKVAPLKDIASMLNLSPVTLSRIRAGTQTKK